MAESLKADTDSQPIPAQRAYTQRFPVDSQRRQPDFRIRVYCAFEFKGVGHIGMKYIEGAACRLQGPSTSFWIGALKEHINMYALTFLLCLAEYREYSFSNMYNRISKMKSAPISGLRHCPFNIYAIISRTMNWVKWRALTSKISGEEYRKS